MTKIMGDILCSKPILQIYQHVEVEAIFPVDAAFRLARVSYGGDVISEQVGYHTQCMIKEGLGNE
jgi:hypothetical protein